MSAPDRYNGGRASAGPRPCGWCPRAAVGTVEVQPQRFAVRGGIKVLIAHAISVPACPRHVGIVDDQPQSEDVLGVEQLELEGP